MGRLVGDGTWLTVGEALERLKAEPKPVPISYSTLKRMVDRGELPATHVGIRRDRRLLAKAVDALNDRMWAEAHPEDAPGPTPEEGQSQQDH